MRITLFTIVLLLAISSYGQNSKGETLPLKYFDSGSMFFEKIYPACTDYKAAGIAKFNNFGMEVEFLGLGQGRWRWKQKAGFLLGGKKSENLISDIEFEGGYLGGFNAWQNRFSTSLGTVIAFQPNPKLELGIPLMFQARYTSVVGRFYLYEGQDVDEADVVENHEANTANKIVFNRKWMPGFRTGLEFVGFPNSTMSLVARFNYQYYGKRDVYDVSSAQLVAGEVQMSDQRVWSTPEWGFSIGIRFTAVEVGQTRTKPDKKEKKKDKPVILDPKTRQ